MDPTIAPPSLPGHAVFLLLVQLSVVLCCARVGAEVSRRVGLPAVVGEILAGIALGPSLLGRWAPTFSAQLFPRDAVQFHLLDALGQVGMVLLLLLTGLELDLRLLRRVGRPATLASVLGMVLPFAMGFGLAWFLPESYLVDPSRRTLFAFFLATAMAISAMPVIAKILMDLHLTQRDLGIVILSACIVDDAAGWLILSLIAGAAAESQVQVMGLLGTVGLLLVFLVALPLVVFPFVSRALSWVSTRWRTHDPALVLLLVTTFACAATTDWIGVHPVFGAFLAGVMFRQVPRLDDATVQRLESFVMGVLAPIFFAVVGLKVDLANLSGGWGIPLLVLAVACAGKLLGSGLGAALGGLNAAESFGVAVAMNARGAMGLVVATTGLSLGLLSQEMFSIIVLVAVVTSLMAPVGLRLVLPRLPLHDAERRRATEARARGLLEPGSVRVLLPTSGGRHSRGAAYLAGGIARRSSLPVELFTVETAPASWPTRLQMAWSGSTGDDARERALEELSRIASGEQWARRRTVQQSDVAGAIQDESKEYDLLVLGASTPDRPLSGDVLGPVVAAAPCHAVVLRSAAETHGFRRLLVPVDGSLLARAAVELAVRYCEATDAELCLLLATGTRGEGPPDLERISPLFAATTVRARVTVRPDGEAVEGILQEIREGGHDLTVVGAENRAVEGTLSFGHNAERLLTESEHSVAVVVPHFERLARELARAARAH